MWSGKESVEDTNRLKYPVNQLKYVLTGYFTG